MSKTSRISEAFRYACAWDESSRDYKATCAEFPGLEAHADIPEEAIITLRGLVEDLVIEKIVAGVATPKPVKVK